MELCPDAWVINYTNCKDLLKFDFFRHFSLLGAAGNRHLAEFVP